MPKQKVQFMETVLRDGQQSLIATRMPISDILPILDKMDAAGYASLEMWGGAGESCCFNCWFSKSSRSGSSPFACQ